MPSDSCADRLKVLADRTRLDVLLQLLAGPRQVGEINDELGIDPSLLSHHLRVLREAGLVESERAGKAVRYRLAPGIGKGARRRALDLGCCSLRFDRLP